MQRTDNRGRKPSQLTWQDCEKSTPEAVAHGVCPEANVHPCILLLGSSNHQFVQVGAIWAGPDLPRGQHDELLSPNIDGGVVLALRAILHPLQPLDDGLDVAAHLALEGGGATVVHRGVHGVCPCQDGLGPRPLCTETQAAPWEKGFADLSNFRNREKE